MDVYIESILYYLEVSNKSIVYYLDVYMDIYCIFNIYRLDIVYISAYMGYILDYLEVSIGCIHCIIWLYILYYMDIYIYIESIY